MRLFSPRNGALPRDFRTQQTLSAQVKLLYASANVSFGVTLIAATLLAYLEWRTVSHSVVLAWWIYTVVVAAARYVLALRYRLASEESRSAIGKWRALFTAGAALAGVGWGAAGILLYQEAHLTNQIFLIFVVGGMMLGAASLLAPRPEAFLTFLIPAGLAPAVRLLLQGDSTHLAMGVLAGVFTIATLITTARIGCTIASSLNLQFENRDLVENLQAAKNETDALNQALELRVQERTAELRAEIAQREKMEEELLRTRKLESLGVLAGGIAHDFNNFLTVVQGNIELALTKLSEGHPVREALDEAAGTCNRAKFLSSQLLTFAKGGTPVRRVTSVAQLVMDAVQLARAGAPISIAVHLAEDLYFARVDPAQIGQVLHNILLNARQAMPLGGIIEVAAENATPGSAGGELRVRISIRDYGCGIPAGVLPQIFDPYFTTKPGASGLGLATAYSIVAKHGGQILVDSTPGVGTVMTVELPACREAAAPETAPPVIEFPPSRERILVMDDEAALRKLLKTVLGNLGYEVHTARDGAEAIALYEKARSAGWSYDAVLLDLTVSGGMGGVEAAARLKEIEPNCRLIVSSGYADASVMSEFAVYGFDAVLPKPWTVSELSQVVHRVLAAQAERKLD